MFKNEEKGTLRIWYYILNLFNFYIFVEGKKKKANIVFKLMFCPQCR